MRKYRTRSSRVKSQPPQADPIVNQLREAVPLPNQLSFPGIDPSELTQASDADSRLIRRLSQAHKRPHRSSVRDQWPTKRKK